MDNIAVNDFDIRDDTLLLFLPFWRFFMARESRFENRLIRRLMEDYPGAVILKNNANFFQGIPDRLILYGPRWAAFEVKGHPTAAHQQNQDYYIDVFNEMSYASFVYPENEEQFLHELQQALRPTRRTRLPIRV